jgi:flagellar assembly factor FliW
MQIPNEHLYKGVIEEDTVYQFNKGIPGFEQYTKFTVIPHDECFSIMQSLEEEGLAFIITNPFMFFENYEFELSESDLEELGIESVNEVVVRSIVTWGDSLSDVTTNLMAPLIFNAKTKQGKQIVLYPTTYKSKHPLLKDTTEQKGGDV